MTKKTVFVLVLDGDDETDVTKVKDDLKMLSQNYNGSLYLDSIDKGFGLMGLKKK
jgi:hypothetical protein